MRQEWTINRPPGIPLRAALLIPLWRAMVRGPKQLLPGPQPGLKALSFQMSTGQIAPSMRFSAAATFVPLSHPIGGGLPALSAHLRRRWRMRCAHRRTPVLVGGSCYEMAWATSEHADRPSR